MESPSRRVPLRLPQPQNGELRLGRGDPARRRKHKTGRKSVAVELSTARSAKNVGHGLDARGKGTDTVQVRLLSSG